jgi:oxygen-independent coproporphyrinogen-3 oxidase
MAGIYIHIPFCKVACHYCDFHFSTNLNHQSDLIQCINEELKLQRQYPGSEKIETIYFGGGTPSLMSEGQLNSILDHISSLFNIASDAEITMEVNPDDLSDEKLDVIKRAGVNRLSIGIQTFDDELLKFLNRPHNGQAAIRSFMAARDKGFSNISIDLIYAIPGMTDQRWAADIQQACALKPEHISSYSLTIEEKTVFGKWSKSGKLISITDDTAAAQLEMLVEKLAEDGYEQYEVSNFSQRGFESRHNSSYWKGATYLGVGPSAHSYNGFSRQYNVNNNHAYIKGIQSGIIPFESETLTRQDHINEYLLTGLRTRWGCDTVLLKEKFNYDLLATNADYVRNLLDNRLAIFENKQLILTKAGKRLADKISSDLFVIS